MEKNNETKAAVKKDGSVKTAAVKAAAKRPVKKTETAKAVKAVKASPSKARGATSKVSEDKVKKEITVRDTGATVLKVAETPEKLKVLVVASECVPFIKTGGLADVVGALPQALSAYADVRVMIPKFGSIPEELKSKMTKLMNFYVHMGWRRQYVGIETMQIGNITYYFLDNEYYFARGYTYGYGELEAERFAYFNRAVLESIVHLGFIPDVLHLNDWQTGMIPVLLETQYRTREEYKNIRTLYTIHNLQYQGIFAFSWLQELLGLESYLFAPDKIEHYGMGSFMKAALTYANHITTVSPTYAKEVMTPEFGEKLDGLMWARRSDVTGILNGIDTTAYDPENDPYIAARYNLSNLEGKAANKQKLQLELGLDEDASAPLIAFIGRLAPQKGLDIVEKVIDDIMQLGVQFAVLGMGDEQYVNMCSWMQWRYPKAFALRCEMNEQLAHRIYAGADMLLMPSRFEPCGLSQMIALRYGTLPVVRETGGLCDTVLSYNEDNGEGNGFSFSSYDSGDMLYTVRRAATFYKERPEVWKMLMERGMGTDFSWDNSARKYLEVYRLLDGRSEE